MLSAECWTIHKNLEDIFKFEFLILVIEDDRQHSVASIATQSLTDQLLAESEQQLCQFCSSLSETEMFFSPLRSDARYAMLLVAFGDSFDCAWH